MNTQKILLTLVLNLSGFLSLYSQNVISSCVNYTTNDQGTTYWAIGELATETFAGENVVLTQGFYQSKLLATELVEIDNPKLEILVFPNPVTDALIVKQNNSNTDLKYQIMMISGKLICEGTLTGEVTEVPFNQIPVGNYVLSLIMNKNRVKSFKIEKQLKLWR